MAMIIAKEQIPHFTKAPFLFIFSWESRISESLLVIIPTASIKPAPKNKASAFVVPTVLKSIVLVKSHGKKFILANVRPVKIAKTATEDKKA